MGRRAFFSWVNRVRWWLERQAFGRAGMQREPDLEVVQGGVLDEGQMDRNTPIAGARMMKIP
jgi:hypothetical protein